MTSGRRKREEIDARRAEKRGEEELFPERSDKRRSAYRDKADRDFEKRRETEIEAAIRQHGAVRVDPSQLEPSGLYGSSLAMRGYYLPVLFACKTCGKEEVWTPDQQKWFYEVVKGNPDAGPSRCRPCRAAERERKEAARRVHREGVERKRREKEAPG